MSSMRASSHRQLTERVSPMLRTALQKTVVLLCVLAPIGLQAQSDPCSADILNRQATPAQCPACTSSPLVPVPQPDNLAEAAKSELAIAWIDPHSTANVLQAFYLLISGRPVFSKEHHEWLTVSQQILATLVVARPQSGDLFRAVVGNPDGHGDPTVQGLPDLIDVLSKASTRGKVDSNIEIDYHHQLFGCTQAVIDQLFKGDGVLALVSVNDAFSKKNNYVAMYNLLNAVWDQRKDAKRLEQLRAAFAISVDDLAKQVAAKIAPAK